MTQVMAFVLIAAAGGLGFWLWTGYRRWKQSQRSSEERIANVMVDAMTTAKGKPAGDQAAMAQQRLLYDAATKAGEAGEVVLSIQLYARLIARYPDSALGPQARAAVEEHKKKLAKPKAPGIAGRG